MRWNSSYNQGKEVMIQYLALNKVADLLNQSRPPVANPGKFDENEVALLEQVLDILEPFDEMTKFVS